MSIDNKNKEEFIEKLKNIVKEYNVKGAAFTGTLGDEYLGLMALDYMEASRNINTIFQSVLNIGRLWQQARTTIKNIIGDFEKV